VLGIPGVVRESGPRTGDDPVVEERWELSGHRDRAVALIEAGAYGPTLGDAASALLAERAAEAGDDVGRLADVLFDAALCGCLSRSEGIVRSIAAGIGGAVRVAELGRVLATVLGLWRHDRLLGTAGHPLFGAVITGCVERVLWLVEGVRGGPAPADLERLYALAATRDALRHAAGPLGLDRQAALGVARRVSVDTAAPPDLRGAAFGLAWSLGEAADAARAVRGVSGPDTLGDWLAGLFALARDEVLAVETAADGAGGGVLRVLDEIVAGWPERDFLVALPALRQAFEFFPPLERETIARRLLEHRGLRGSARSLLRTAADPLLIAEAMELEEKVRRVLAAEGLAPRGEPS